MSDISNRVDINRVLMQMRDMRAQVQPMQAQPLAPNMIQPGNGLDAAARADLINPTSATESGSFADLLKQADVL